MALSLLKAAREGNIETLYNLCKDDTSILEGFEDESPLHVAAKYGRDEFVTALISMMQDNMIKQFNREGFTAIHIACLNGNLGVVDTLWNYSSYFWNVKTKKNGDTPLHCACKKGRHGIIDFILQKCPRSILEKNNNEESALHLVIRNEEFEAFRQLVNFLEGRTKYLSILNSEDIAGNTIIHVTVIKSYYQVMDFILEFKKKMEAIFVLEIDTRNKSGKSALDLCPSSSNDAEDLYIKMALMEGCSSSSHVTTDASLRRSSHGVELKSFTDTGGDVKHYVEETHRAMGPNEVRVDLLFVFGLITGLTYLGFSSPPGGFDVHSSPSLSPSSAPDNTVLGMETFRYLCFMFFNSGAFYISIFNLMKLVYHLRLLWELNFAFIALLVNYNYTIITTAPEGLCRKVAWSVCLLLPVLLQILSRLNKWFITRKQNNTSEQRNYLPLSRVDEDEGEDDLT